MLGRLLTSSIPCTTTASGFPATLPQNDKICRNKKTTEPRGPTVLDIVSRLLAQPESRACRNKNQLRQLCHLIGCKGNYRRQKHGCSCSESWFDSSIMLVEMKPPSIFAESLGMSATASLIGSFLVARHSLRDPRFRQSVVLVIDHDSLGAFGVVVNRPTPAAEFPFPIFAGGPCKVDGLILLHGHVRWARESKRPRRVAPGIFLGTASCMERAIEAPSDKNLRFRVFAGYAGWEAGQLERERAAGDWEVVPATGKILFGTPTEILWDYLAPPRIPQHSLN